MQTFEDSHGVKCILQDDISFTKGKILRIGVEYPTVEMEDAGYLYDLGDVLDCCKVNHRMHLSQDDVKKIIPALIHFAEFGEVAESLQGLGRGKQINLTKNLLKLLFPDAMLKVEGRIGDTK